jgi:hypothetical protein
MRGNRILLGFMLAASACAAPPREYSCEVASGSVTPSNGPGVAIGGCSWNARPDKPAFMFTGSGLLLAVQFGATPASATWTSVAWDGDAPRFDDPQEDVLDIDLALSEGQTSIYALIDSTYARAVGGGAATLDGTPLSTMLGHSNQATINFANAELFGDVSLGGSVSVSATVYPVE